MSSPVIFGTKIAFFGKNVGAANLLIGSARIAETSDSLKGLEDFNNEFICCTLHKNLIIISIAAKYPEQIIILLTGNQRLNLNNVLPSYATTPVNCIEILHNARY